MGRQICKRNRVYSIKPNNLDCIVLARKYISYLLPALKKINEKTSPDHEENVDSKFQIVHFEVNMAMALSAKEFAWSQALKAKLEKNVNVGGLFFNSSLYHTFPMKLQKVGECLTSSSTSKTLVPFKSLQNCSFVPKMKRKKKKKYIRSTSRRLKCPSRREEEVKEKTSDNGIVNKKLTHLRMILPGGNEMGETELFKELSSYITCLELQVNILQGLVATN